MEFKISKELFDTNAQEIVTNGSSSKAAIATSTVMKLTVEREPTKLEFARNMLFFIGLIQNVFLDNSFSGTSTKTSSSDSNNLFFHLVLNSKSILGEME